MGRLFDSHGLDSIGKYGGMNAIGKEGVGWMGEGELLDRIDLFVFDGAVGRRMFFMSEH